MKTTIFGKAFLGMAICCLAWGCSEDEPYIASDNNNNEQKPGEEQNPGGEEIPGEEIMPTDDLVLFDIAFNTDPLTETENIPTDELLEEYNDYLEHSEFERTVTITFSGETAEVIKTSKDVRYTIDGAHVTVNSTAKKVEYIVKGESSNGSLKIYSENKFKLQLEGVNLTNPKGAPINIQCKKRCYFVCNDESVNTLTDATVYNAAPNNEDEKGCIFSEGKIIFSGSGKLQVYGQGKHGISSDDYVRFRAGCNIYIQTTSGHGVKTNDAIYVNGGVLNLDVKGDGKKGLSTDGELKIEGGRTTIITSGAAIYENDEQDVSGCAAIKCDSIFVMNAGILNLKSTGSGGKGLNVDKSITINGGELNVLTTGGNYVYGDNQTTSTRGIGSGEEMIVNGGTICCYSMANDAIEADGKLTVNGGTIIASGAQAPYKGIHSKQNFAITAGTVISTGGEATNVSENETTQPFITINAERIAVNTWLALENQNGENVCCYQMPRSYQNLNWMISTSELKSGETYQILTDGNTTGGNEWHGYVTGGTYSNGNTLTTSIAQP